VLDLLMRLNEQTGATIVIVTHAAPVASLAHRVLHLTTNGISATRNDQAPDGGGHQLVSVLARKLRRDLIELRGMLAAVVAIVAFGIAALVGLQATMDNLVAARDAYYAKCRAWRTSGSI
jgi:energy-coupling factor transporter ATP-binding protein EcfA2